MSRILCPNCGSEFSVDDAQLDSIVSQIRTEEFNKEVETKVSETLKSASEKADLEMQIRVNSAKESAEEKAKIEISAMEKERDVLRKQIQDLERINTELKADISNAKQSEELAVLKAVRDIQDKNHDLEMKLSSQRDSYEFQLKEKEEQISFYKDLKTKMSTKMVGETLEQHCATQFETIRGALPKTIAFGKDNEVSSSGSKGDFIYREWDEDHNEVVSIMFEMKNEMDTTITKHKNEDFFKELDKDRKEKDCEYAVLVSLLEGDNEIYNAGIVDVSYKYEKMYVVRPQCFLPIITILRNAAMTAMDYKRELSMVKSSNLDVAMFEEKLFDFKEDFSRNYRIAHSHFDKAIEEIDKTIDHLKKVRDELVGSDRQLRIANDKVEDVSIKKLTKGNPTMEEKFKQINT